MMGQSSVKCSTKLRGGSEYEILTLKGMFADVQNTDAGVKNPNRKLQVTEVFPDYKTYKQTPLSKSLNI